MKDLNSTFDIHLHGEIPLHAKVTFDQVKDALKPLWTYAGARSFEEGAASSFEDEPGIHFNEQDMLLEFCWTVPGEDDFRQCLDEMCMSLNELSVVGATIEVTFYDTEFDEEDEDDGRESLDDFLMLFVGPTPAAIMQAQRDLLIADVFHMMERHFEPSELGGIANEIDRLFSDRFNNLVNSLEMGKPGERGSNGGGNSNNSGHGGQRKPRHLH
jgi:hypothetical protein